MANFYGFEYDRKECRELTEVFDYIDKCLAGEIIKGQTELNVYKRFIKELQDPDFPYYFSIAHCKWVVKISKLLVKNDGRKPIALTLHPFQYFIVFNLFAWREKERGIRRFRKSVISVARRNGKSLLNALIVLLSLFEGKKNQRIFLASPLLAQSKIVYDELKKFCTAHPELDKMFKFMDYKSEGIFKPTSCDIKCLAKTADKYDGFSSLLVVLDEVALFDNIKMQKVLMDGQQSEVEALTSMISTTGFNLEAPFFDEFLYCRDVIAGKVRNDRYFAFISELDQDDNIFDYKCVAKAHPFAFFNHDGTLNMTYINDFMQMADEVRHKGGADLNNYKVKFCNKWEAGEGELLFDLDYLDKCFVEKDLEQMRGKECILGLDLSSGGDLTSICLLFDKEEKPFVFTQSFIPQKRFEEHLKTDTGKYESWRQDGILTCTSGNTGFKLDYHTVVDYIKFIIKEYDLRISEVAYDRHNASAFLQDLMFLDCEFTEVVQSARNLNDATRDIALTVKDNDIEFGNREKLLRWSCQNSYLVFNSFGECKIDKVIGSKRIDAVDALIDAWFIYFLRKQVLNINAEVENWL